VENVLKVKLWFNLDVMPQLLGSKVSKPCRFPNVSTLVAKLCLVTRSSLTPPTTGGLIYPWFFIWHLCFFLLKYGLVICNLPKTKFTFKGGDAPTIHDQPPNQLVLLSKLEGGDRKRVSKKS